SRPVEHNSSDAAGFRKNSIVEPIVTFAKATILQALNGEADGGAYQYDCHDGVGGPVRAPRRIRGPSLAQSPGRAAHEIDGAPEGSGRDQKRGCGPDAAALRPTAHAAEPARGGLAGRRSAGRNVHVDLRAAGPRQTHGAVLDRAE